MATATADAPAGGIARIIFGLTATATSQAYAGVISTFLPRDITVMMGVENQRWAAALVHDRWVVEEE